mmetsp:Transcript_62262/g.200730  ORF Transcript_62262/g.200730 Transcript_62262/m.200730 type:complete len:201 (+) Transcript_62262:510-1112(+)
MEELDAAHTAVLCLDEPKLAIVETPIHRLGQVESQETVARLNAKLLAVLLEHINGYLLLWGSKSRQLAAAPNEHGLQVLLEAWVVGQGSCAPAVRVAQDRLAPLLGHNAQLVNPSFERAHAHRIAQRAREEGLATSDFVRLRPQDLDNAGDVGLALLLNELLAQVAQHVCGQPRRDLPPLGGRLQNNRHLLHCSNCNNAR